MATAKSKTSSKTDEELKTIKTKVEKKIKRASAFKRTQNFVIYGREGVGKTRVAATAPEPLIIDVDEEGTDSVRRDIDPRVIQIKAWSEINDIYWYLQSGDHPFESVVIDGVTGLQNLCLNFVLGEEHARDASRDPDMPARQAWGKVGKLMRTQITNFRNLPLHCILTALERNREQGEDEDEITIFTGPAVTPSIQGHLTAAVQTVGYLTKREVVVRSKRTKKVRREVRRRLFLGDSQRYSTKDRNGVFGDYIDAPDISEMLALIYGKEA